MTTEDIDFIKEYAKCGIYHNYMHNEDELMIRIKRLNSIIDVEESNEVARQQVRENLSYYIGLADAFQKERDMWRDNFFKQNAYIQELEDTLGLRNKDEYIKQQEEHAKNFGGI